MAASSWTCRVDLLCPKLQSGPRFGCVVCIVVHLGRWVAWATGVGQTGGAPNKLPRPARNPGLAATPLVPRQCRDDSIHDGQLQLTLPRRCKLHVRIETRESNSTYIAPNLSTSPIPTSSTPQATASASHPLVDRQNPEYEPRSPADCASQAREPSRASWPRSPKPPTPWWHCRYSSSRRSWCGTSPNTAQFVSPPTSDAQPRTTHPARS